MGSNKLIGCVKWFNSKYKYGFITVISEGEYNNVDLFVHQSNIITKEPCYRYLVAGETVTFEVKIIDDEKHPKQAVSVCNTNNSLLKCEMPKPIYNETSNRNTHFNNQNNNEFTTSRGRGRGMSRGRGMGRGGINSNTISTPSIVKSETN